MKFSGVILYVPDVRKTLAFYERMGAKRAKEWWPYVVQGEELPQLAAEPDVPRNTTI